LSRSAFVRVSLAACLALLAGAALAAAPEGVALHCSPKPVMANEDGAWSLTLRMVNLSGYGVYGDSLSLAVLPSVPEAGAGAAAASAASGERHLQTPGGAETISAGDSVEATVDVPASAPSARIVVRFHAHDHDGRPFFVADTVVADGSVLDARYPSTLVRAGGRTVELVKVAADPEAAGGAGVLLLPGEGTEARGMLVSASRLARAGIAVVIVGAPGCGRSQGPDDLAGPASRAAALAGLDTLLHMPQVDRARVGAWGISRGGTLALALALDQPAAFRAVAAQAAGYDLWATWRAASPADRAAIEAAAGRDSAGWRARSPLLRAATLQPALLVVHGERDPIVPAAGAHAFAEAARAAGHGVTARFLPSAQHTLGATDAMRFLVQQLNAPR
jgi:alpha-beta hydrolase superfamily lysophospholipase